jgi:hypothetical protein
MTKFDDAYSNDQKDDALKVNNSSENVSLYRNQISLSVERRKNITANDTLFLNVANFGIKNYQWLIPATNLDAPGRNGFLYDRYRDKYNPLDLNDTNRIDFSVTADAASAAPNRFMIIFNKSAAMPVTITSVSASRNADGTININWEVENEINISRYEIERSADGRVFSSIVNKIASANNGGTSQYGHIDGSPLGADNFYRIKAISQDGQIQYSSIVKVSPQRSNPAIVVYPNPVQDRTIQLRFDNKEKGKYALQLINASGAVLFNGSVTIQQTTLVKAIALPASIAAGQYKLRLVGPFGEQEEINLSIID